MSNDTGPRDEFVERVAHPLRAPERVDTTFEPRVMSAVRAERTQASRRTQAWTLHVRPIVALAAAIAFAAVVLGAEAGVRRLAGTPSAAGSVDTVLLVRFVLTDPSARQVALVGSFNQWRKDAISLRPTGVPGAWTASVVLPPGRHEYAFVVNDGAHERWIADPVLPAVHDEFGTETSVLALKARMVD